MHPAGIKCGLFTYVFKDLQICKLRSYGLLHLKLVNLFVEKQIMLPATLPDFESKLLRCKNILLPK